MKITYTGRQVELAPAQFKKLEARFAKIGKLLDGRRECGAHVVISLERHLHRAEATINYFDHQLAGLGKNSDLFTAIHTAAEHLEKQAVKARSKWRDTKRTRRAVEAATTKAEKAPAAASAAEPVRHVFRVNHHDQRKPMTLEEAILEMDENRNYMVYRDAESDRVSVLLRRKDGHFDLVEG